MMNLESITVYAHAYYTNMVVHQHGPAANEVLKDLLSFIKALYKQVAPETLTGRILIFKTLDVSVTPALPDNNVSISIASTAGLPTGDLVIQCLGSGFYKLWNAPQVAIKDLSGGSVVYSYENEVEHFHAKDSTSQVEKLVQDCASSFAVPTFAELNEALERYSQTNVKHSSCQILNQIWYDKERLFLIAGPEFHIRNSLTQFLKARLRGSIEVRPEQVVDDSHPVDIKVTWWMTNRLALIEIKWLGQSRTKAKVGTKYTASRARDGAKQLADYLDANQAQSPTQQTRGYLVVLDARRAKLSGKTTSLSRANGYAYEHDELAFAPKYHETRTDFHKPFRMFAEPKVGTGA